MCCINTVVSSLGTYSVEAVGGVSESQNGREKSAKTSWRETKESLAYMESYHASSKQLASD